MSHLILLELPWWVAFHSLAGESCGGRVKLTPFSAWVTRPGLGSNAACVPPMTPYIKTLAKCSSRKSPRMENKVENVVLTARGLAEDPG